MKIVSASPHLHSGASTSSIMRDVIIALTPAFGFSLYVFGWQALLTTAIAICACVIFEWAITKYMLRKAPTINDWSAVVTGYLLAFNLPYDISPWLIVMGALVAIGIGKMSFGGLGRNPFNPALVGRVFLLISFPVQMTTFTGADGVTGATPLTLVKEALAKGSMPDIDMSGMLLGFKSGSLGEIAGILLIIGGIYLLVRKVISWHIPVYVLGTMAVFSGILYLCDPAQFTSPLFNIFTGGALLGAIYMATDYSTSPMSKRGMAIFGVGIGLITMLIRTWGAYPEGISFAILIMNACVPIINMYVKPKRFA